jgi:fimbrial isopeptide formation D2 family protein/LPXTG-motif cell wall-anchored protein
MKRKITRVLAALFAMVMLVSCMSLSAFADDQVISYVDEQDTADNGHIYQLYQIFTGTIDSTSDTITNPLWGANSIPTDPTNKTTPKVGDKVDNTILDNINALKNKTDSDKLAYILQFVDLSTTPANVSDVKRIGSAASSSDYLDQPKVVVGNGATETGYYAFTDLEPGYYLIKDMAKSLDSTESQAYTLYVVKTSNGTINFQPKDSVPTVTKTIDDGSAKGTSSNLLAIGDKVTYNIAGTVSTQIGSFKTYYYKFTDTLSKGLTYNGDAKITLTATKVGSTDTITQDVTNYFGFSNSNSTKTVANANDQQTVLKWATADLLKFNNLTADDKTGDGKAWTPITINASTTLSITYTATLNQYADAAKGITDTNSGGDVTAWNKNTVDLTYYNDPNNSGTETSKDKPSDTPEKDPPEPDPKYPSDDTTDVTVHTFTGSLTVEKQNSSNQPLNGAEFTLTLKSKDGVDSLTDVSNQMVVTGQNATFDEYTISKAYGESGGHVYDSAGNEYNFDDIGTASIPSTQIFTKGGQVLYWKLSQGFGGTDTSVSSVTYTTRNPYDGGKLGSDEAKYASKTVVYTKTDALTTTSAVDSTSSYAVKGYVDDSGLITFTGMGEGTYILTETHAPNGYQVISPIEITVSYEDGKFVVTNGSNAKISYNQTDGSYHMIVEDSPAQALPSTGGIGTTIFYVAGSALALGAIVLLITKKRMSNEVG